MAALLSSGIELQKQLPPPSVDLSGHAEMPAAELAVGTAGSLDHLCLERNHASSHPGTQMNTGIAAFREARGASPLQAMHLIALLFARGAIGSARLSDYQSRLKNDRLGCRVRLFDAF